MSTPLSTRQLAPVERIVALHIGSSLIIAVEGHVPTPCHEVRITVAPERILPAWYQVVMSRSAGVCTEVVTPYTTYERFFVAEPPKEIVVKTSEGPQQVSVVSLPGLLSSPIAASDAGVLPSSVVWSHLRQGDHEKATASIPPPRTAIGYSEAMSFDEAFREAIANLPPTNVGCCDVLETVEVEAIGAEFGGIAGLSRMFVRVRG
ncbi:MAG: hypothetical protein R6X02_02420 [Enhygromyxa sp.]